MMKVLALPALVVCLSVCTALRVGAQAPVGALAIDERQGDRYGWAVDYETDEAAWAAALRECGAGCSVVLTFDRCGAYAADQHPDSTAVGWAESYDSAGGARQASLSECRTLFPPVTRTFHVAPRGDEFDGAHIGAGMEILHCFAAGQRALAADPTANAFRPERWMEPGNSADSMYPNLFLGGARECPGKGLILFVCKAAILALMKDGRMKSVGQELSEDPVPYAFPKSGPRFITGSN